MAQNTSTAPAKAEGFSLTVRDAKAVQDTAQAKANAKAIRDLKVAADRVAGDVMWVAGLETYNVVNVSDQIGEGKAFADQQDYAAHIGYAKAYVTLLKRLGRAAVVHGVRKGSKEWTFLAVNGMRAEVGKAVDAESKDAFAKALAPLMTAAKDNGGKLPPAKRLTGGETDVSGGESTPGRGGADNGEAAASVPMTLDDILRALDETVKGLDREAWAAVESRLDKIVTRENTVRAKAAKREAESKAKGRPQSDAKADAPKADAKA